MPPPPPVEDLHVRLGSVVAALAKQNIKISAEDLLKVTREVDAATCTEFTAEEFRERKSAWLLAQSLIIHLFDAPSHSLTRAGFQPQSSPRR